MIIEKNNMPPGLSESVPANNQKIIEIYNKLRSKQIQINPSYQRKLVWKNAHKFNFIDTILRNFPFPEIYLAPSTLDLVELVLIDEIVDGQQRLSTIRDYIEENDVFALPKLPISRFSELTPEQRTNFLNYEISVRYLKGVTQAQVKEIFQRINKTDYSLNAAERLNAQWGESEFVCFAKQIVDPNFRLESAVFIIDDKLKKPLNDFFHGYGDEVDGIFSKNDNDRMLASQYIMTLIATMNEEDYFHRNEKLAGYIASFNDAFPAAESILYRLTEVVAFIQALDLPNFVRWYKKANLFTLIVELDLFGSKLIDKQLLRSKLVDFDHRASLKELGLAEGNNLTSEEEKYLNWSSEGVNQKNVRISRGDFIKKILIESKLDT
jgi:hypothetical protein